MNAINVAMMRGRAGVGRFEAGAVLPPLVRLQRANVRIVELENEIKRITELLADAVLETKHLRQLKRRNPAEITAQDVVDAVGLYMDVSPLMIMSDTKMVSAVLARMTAYYVMREMMDMSSTEVAYFMRRDHTTVLWGWKAVETKRQKDPDFAETLIEIIYALDAKGAAQCIS